MDRRQLLAALGLGAGAAVVGFDPVARRWVRAAEAASGRLEAEALPDLDGVVVMDEASLAADASDEGNIVHRRPWAVLRPGSVDDIAKMLQFCQLNGVPAAARGQAHTVYGQSLVDGGLVIEMHTLATIHAIAADHADVDAGVLWKDLFAAAVAQGVTPPIFTGYTALTVGGTLSVGGVGVTPNEGVQAQRVRELQVVTASGQVVWCSPTTQGELFEGVLAGNGQLGVITRAILDLIPAPQRVKQWSLLYLDPHAFFRDLRTVLERDEFDCVYGQIAMPALALLADPSPLVAPLGELLPIIETLTGPLARGLGSVVTVPPLPLPTPWVYLLNVAKYHPTEQQPSGAPLLRGLSDLSLLRQSQDRPYLDFVYRVDVLIDFLKAAGLWNGVPHPWCDVFLPGQVVEDFVSDTFADLRFDDVGLAGFGLLFPVRRDTLTRRSLAVPESDTPWIYLFDVLTSAPLPGPNTAFVAEKVARNRAIYERARTQGGTLYSISAVPMEPADWAQQYGPTRYAELVQLKHHHDPAGILTPGIHFT